MYDLLPSAKSRSLPIGPRRALNVREDSHGRVYVDGLTEVLSLPLGLPPSQCRPGRAMSPQGHLGSCPAYVAFGLLVAALKRGLQHVGASEIAA